MAFVEVFTGNLSVAVGTTTKASEYNNLATNADAVRERFIINSWFTNTATANEDGFFKGRYDAPAWHYAKGKTGDKYFCLYMDDDDAFRLYVGTTTAAPTATQGVSLGNQ